MDYFWLLQRTPAVLHPPNPHRTCCRSDQSSHPTTQKSGRNCGTRARRTFWGQLSTVKLVGSGWQWIDLAPYQWASIRWMCVFWSFDSFNLKVGCFHTTPYLCSFCILSTSSLLKRQLSPYSIPGTVTERLKLLCIHDVDFAQILVGLRPEDVTSLWSRRSVVRYSWYKDVWSLAPCPMCCPFNFNVEQGWFRIFTCGHSILKIHIIHQPPKFPCQTCNIQVNNVRVWQQFSDPRWVSLRTGCPAV